MKFTNKRQREVAGERVRGQLIDERGEALPRPTVSYETAGRRWREDAGPRPAEVNWSAMGAQSLDVARDYANQILAACDAAEVGAREFEPGDTVIADDFPEGHIGIVRSNDDHFLVVEVGVSGEVDTWRERTFSFADTLETRFPHPEKRNLRRAES